MKPMRPVDAGDVGPQRLPVLSWLAIVVVLIAAAGSVFLVFMFFYLRSLNIQWQ
jgi:hypothetical protein